MVKHVASSPLRPWQGLTEWFLGPCAATGRASHPRRPPLLFAAQIPTERRTTGCFPKPLLCVPVPKSVPWFVTSESASSPEPILLSWARARPGFCLLSSSQAAASSGMIVRSERPAAVALGHCRSPQGHGFQQPFPAPGTDRTPETLQRTPKGSSCPSDAFTPDGCRCAGCRCAI